MSATARRWPASDRYPGSSDGAPGGLAFVQDLLNTASLGRPPQPDLLASIESGQAWLDTAMDLLRDTDESAPTEAVTLDERGLRQLAAFRDELRDTLREATPQGGAAERSTTGARASVTLSASGAEFHPAGHGAGLLRSYALVQLAVGSIDGRTRRLKICANPHCLGAYYDRSKNSSRVWHDLATCGNAANVRAYRERKRATSGTPD